MVDDALSSELFRDGLKCGEKPRFTLNSSITTIFTCQFHSNDFFSRCVSIFFLFSAEADFSMSMMKKKMEVLENERIEEKNN